MNRSCYLDLKTWSNEPSVDVFLKTCAKNLFVNICQ